MQHSIPKAKYEGYLWQSDQTAPRVLDGTTEEELSFQDGENPFVVEGQLWDREHSRSVSIRYTDGQYYVKETVLSQAQMQEPVLTYLPHRLSATNSMPEIKGLNFLRLWKEEEDRLCENMPVLTLCDTVFVGFEK